MAFSARVISIKDLPHAVAEMGEIGVHGGGIDIMAPKAVFRAVKLTGVSVVAANILKQDMLSRGGEAATSNDTINHAAKTTDIILSGTLAQFRSLSERLKDQQFKLPQIAAEIETALQKYDEIPAPVLGMEFGKKTFIMGVLNVTPDSFSDGGASMDKDAAVSNAGRMFREGADIIDVGGESTRQGAQIVEASIEIERIVPVIKAVAADKKGLISVDTRKANVAYEALKAGADIINDVSGLVHDPEMAAVAAAAGAPVIIMHSKGTPENMQNDPRYDDVMLEIMRYFEERIAYAVGQGIKEENIIIDPGIGFGKTAAHNITILQRIGELRSMGRPVCLGVSRKSFLGAILGEKDPMKRELGTSVANALAISNGVDIIRVHNIFDSVQTVKISDTIARRKIL